MIRHINISVKGADLLSEIDIKKISGRAAYEVVRSEPPLSENGSYAFSLILTGNREIRKLNRRWRGKDSVTDVLSFPFYDFPSFADKLNFHFKGTVYLGDIAICTDRLKKQAKLYGHSQKREFAFLLTHSLYHLYGYDHISENEDMEMRRKQTAVMRQLGLEI